MAQFATVRILCTGSHPFFEMKHVRSALIPQGFETYEAAFEWMCATHGRRGALELSRGAFGDALKTLGVTSSKVLRRLWCAAARQRLGTLNKP